jgi:hypothetical protein
VPAAGYHFRLPVLFYLSLPLDITPTKFFSRKKLVAMDAGAFQAGLDHLI